MARAPYLPRAGDKVVVPPGYGHVSINPGSNYLVMTNLVAEAFPSLYDTYRTLRGADYHLIGDCHGQSWTKNINYHCDQSVRLLQVREIPELGLENHLPLYKSFISNPDIFSYLVEPEQTASIAAAALLV